MPCYAVGGKSGGRSMKYKVCAHLLYADGKIAKDLGEIEIEVSGPLARGAVAKFDNLNKTEVGTLMDVERYKEPDRVPTVYIRPSLGE
jgi:hypothetical protein